MCITAWVKESQTKFNKFKQIETKLNKIEQEGSSILENQTQSQTRNPGKTNQDRVN